MSPCVRYTVQSPQTGGTTLVPVIASALSLSECPEDAEIAGSQLEESASADDPSIHVGRESYQEVEQRREGNDLWLKRLIHSCSISTAMRSIRLFHRNCHPRIRKDENEMSVIECSCKLIVKVEQADKSATVLDSSRGDAVSKIGKCVVPIFKRPTKRAIQRNTVIRRGSRLDS